MSKELRTSVKIGRMEMKNPVTTASGTFGSGLDMTDYVDLNRLGAITIKGTTLTQRDGTLPPQNRRVTLGYSRIGWLGKSGR